MGKIEAKILPGFMELLPDEQVLFNKMADKIRKSYERFGFIPLDTPIIEYAEVLLAKAGGETEKQIYRFNKGDTDVALRFDLTVPLARYVAQNFYSLTFPFRRYQIGKSFRGEKAQRGRYREFYQCDIDIIGDKELSVMNDAEIPSIIYTTFRELGFNDFTIRINNRKILTGFFAELGYSDLISDILRVIDKMDKIGVDKVKELLDKIDIEKSAINKIIDFIAITGSSKDVLDKLKGLAVKNEIFNEGVLELQEVINGVRNFGVPDKNYKIDLTIARGLDYYTGTVYETVLDNYPQIGSICSGGRYDNLAENYTDKKLPGVGVSIGLTRLFYQLKEAGLIVANNSTLSDLLIIPMTEDLSYAIKIASKLRDNNINTEIYYNKKSIKGRFNYANKLKIPYVMVIGEDEINSNKYMLKNMETGIQQLLSEDEVISCLKEA